MVLSSCALEGRSIAVYWGCLASEKSIVLLMFWQIKETHNLQGFAPQAVHHLNEKLLYYLNVANNFDSPSIEIQYHTGRKAGKLDFLCHKLGFTSISGHQQLWLREHDTQTTTRYKALDPSSQ